MLLKPYKKYDSFILKFQEIIITVKVGVFVTLVCSRRVSGPSPLHGTIVNNVDIDRNKQAFNTRVSKPNIIFILLLSGSSTVNVYTIWSLSHNTSHEHGHIWFMLTVFYQQVLKS